MSRIASSATAVLIAHVAANTSTIRLGSGGVMLPNHSPLVIAEQFGTLAELHPGRIDLGLGRAPGTDGVTLQALRRDPYASDRFPEDVLELQAFFSDKSIVSGVRAIPGEGTRVPIYILGSSLFGAQLAGDLGLPYAFASHFAPAALHQALDVYRRRFRPSAQAEAPHVIVAVNVITAETEAEAEAEHVLTRHARARLLFRGRSGRLTEEEIDAILAGPQASAIDEMMRYTVSGTPDQVISGLAMLARDTDADELMVVPQGSTINSRFQSLDLLGSSLSRSSQA